MRKWFKGSAMLLAVIVAMSALLGACGSQGGTETTAAPTEKNETAEHVKVKMYFFGAPSEDHDMVFAELNKKLTEKVNAELEAGFLDWAEWEQRYPLLFSAGEDFDVIFTCTWAFYASTAEKGGFAELTQELREKYMPLTMKNLPEMGWLGTAYNGKNYMVPYNAFYATSAGVGIRGDLREKYSLPEVNSIESLELYMDTILKNEKGMIPMDTNAAGTAIRQIPYTFIFYPTGNVPVADTEGCTLNYYYDDPDKFVMKNFWEVEGCMDMLKRVAEWNKKGYISKSDLTSQDMTGERFRAGKSAVAFGALQTISYYWSDAKKNHPDWKVEYWNIQEGKKLNFAGYSGNGCGFNAKSKNLTRAMMVVDLLGYDPEINFLINRGIPGVHQNLVGTRTYDGVEYNVYEATPANKYSLASWCFSNSMTFAKDEEVIPGYNDLFYSFNMKQRGEHPLDGALYNPESFQTEAAAVLPIYKQYAPMLFLGFNEDPQKTLDEMITKLKAAGLDKVNDGYYKQGQERFNAIKAAMKK